jgi:uncharacterized protein
VVQRIVQRTGRRVTELMGQPGVLRGLRPEEFADADFGVPTVKDILSELEKPGRDPRPEFRTAAFKEGVHAMGDLQPGMLLEGVVTNVANFGAFVDIGVHQDGLVHVSQLANRFVKDPRDVVKAGDIVMVKVVDVDLKRRRIGLTMKLQDPVVTAPRKLQADVPRSAGASETAKAPARPPRPTPAASASPATSMAAAFEKLRSR